MNKLCIAVAMLGGLFAGGVFATGAASATPSVPVQSCGTTERGLAHVAVTAARPQACCSGKLQSAQFMSTITLEHPEGGKHT